MTEYPRPHHNNTFNPIDYDNGNEIDISTDTYDHTKLLSLEGGILTGQLKLPSVKFGDNSIQTHAYTSGERSVLMSNITDINNNTSAITSNATNINTNTSAITSSATDINNNTSAITSNATNINTNTSAIVSNATNINTNTSAITSNANSLSVHQADIIEHGEDIYLLQQNNEYTDADQTAVITELPNRITALETNNTISTNPKIATLETDVSLIQQRLHESFFIIPFTNVELLGGVSLANGTRVGNNTFVDIDIGHLLYHTYSQTNDWYYSTGEFRNYNSWELNFTGKFHSNNGYIYRMLSGFRILKTSDGSESSTSTVSIDGGMTSSSTGTSFYETYRYNTGPFIIPSFATTELYGNYKLFLRTHFDVQTPVNGTIALNGLLTMRRLIR
jgi:hypothetical protein